MAASRADILRPMRAQLATALSAGNLLGRLTEIDARRATPIGRRALARLMADSRRTRRHIQTASSFLEHMLIVEHLLHIPADVTGVVVECGTFKGGSAANLSRACKLLDRELVIFDSFDGLPEPDADDRQHRIHGHQRSEVYSKGGYAGALEEVRANITTHGAIDVCRLVEGYFETTLPEFAEPAAIAFVDVDLRASLEICVRELWPQIVEGGALFTHEASQFEIAQLFYDVDWWRAQLDTDAPGLAGAGWGIGLSPQGGAFGSNLGRAIKP